MKTLTRNTSTKEQKNFLHKRNVTLELFATSLFGKKYRNSSEIVDVSFWKRFYIATFDVLNESVFLSIGMIDKTHKEAIQNEITLTLEGLRSAKKKDEIHGLLIVSLFKLVFLLLGRQPYYARGKRRDFSTFRTLTYSQDEEQLSWLLQGYVQKNANEHGFEDFFDADRAFYKWCKKNKRQRSDRCAYVRWVRLNFPETYTKFR